MITGGFGVMMDLQTGAKRRWFMGRDGVKRWVDTEEPVGNSGTPHTNFVFTCCDAEPFKHMDGRRFMVASND